MLGKQDRIFDPSLFKQYLKSKMISLLESIAGRKLLMLDVDVRVPINLIIQRKVLSEHGIPQQGGILPFQPIPVPNNQDQIMILMRPTPSNLITLKQLIQVNKNRGTKRYFPCFWPKRNIIIKQFLQQNVLNDLVDIRDFSFDLLPIDVDVYSLETKFVRQLYVQHDHSIYSTVAESIHRLQCVFGKISNFYGKGRAAKAVLDILKIKQNEIKIQENYGDIQSLIIFDRSCDFLTPLLKQTTYDGLTDQLFGLSGSITKIPSSKFEAQPNKDKKNEAAYRQIKLNSEKDYIYQQIRGLSLMGVRSILKVRGAQHDNFTQQAAKMRDINEKSNAIKKINIQKDLLKTHFQLLSILQQQQKTIRFHKQLILQQQSLLQKQQQLIQYYQNMIPFNIPLQNIIKNMSIQSIISKGVNKKIYGKICQEICFSHGMKHIVSLTSLANLGIFYEAGSLKEVYPYADIRKELKLISQVPIDHVNPQDCSFAYGGYIPVIARLVENALRNGWRQIMKPLTKMIPGDTILPDFHKACNSHPRPAVVVYFVGGVTYGQIATLRLLGKYLKREIVVATTEILNGDTMIAQLLE